MYLTCKNNFRNTIFSAVIDAFDIYLEDSDIIVTIPDLVVNGDLSTTVAFKLSKILRTDPKIIAQKLAPYLVAYGVFDHYAVVGGYINAHFDKAKFIAGMLHRNEFIIYPE